MFTGHRKRNNLLKLQKGKFGLKMKNFLTVVLGKLSTGRLPMEVVGFCLLDFLKIMLNKHLSAMK